MDTSLKCPTPEMVWPYEWVRRATCPIFHGQGHLHLSDEEQQWLTVELAKLQGDSLAKWVKLSSKGAAKAKYSNLGFGWSRQIGKMGMQCVVCMRMQSSSIDAKRTLRDLVLLSKCAHNHEIEKIPKESSGSELEGTTKKQVKNFLGYKRTLLASNNKLGDFITTIKEDVHMENKAIPRTSALWSIMKLATDSQTKIRSKY
eukprot:scaffold1257_cov311-Pavlova_lutheri.AAC.5